MVVSINVATMALVGKSLQPQCALSSQNSLGQPADRAYRFCESLPNQPIFQQPCDRASNGASNGKITWGKASKCALRRHTRKPQVRALRHRRGRTNLDVYLERIGALLACAYVFGVAAYHAHPQHRGALCATPRSSTATNSHRTRRAPRAAIDSTSLHRATYRPPFGSIGAVLPVTAATQSATGVFRLPSQRPSERRLLHSSLDERPAIARIVLG